MAIEKKSAIPKKTAAVPSSLPTNPTTNSNGTNDPAAVPPIRTAPPIAPVHAFPVDPIPEPKRGPGRPPKVCDICGKIPSECKGHAKVAFSIGDETVKGLINLLSQLTSLGLSLSTGVSAESLAKIWNFTEGEKAIIVPPAAELINKNAPDWMVKYETELKLGFFALPLLIAKLSMTHALVKMHRETLEKEKSSPSPAAGSPKSTAPAQAAAA